MPRVSQEKQLARQLVLSQKQAFTAKELAQSIGSETKNKVNLARHYLLEFWKQGIVVRSQQEINLEYYYAAKNPGETTQILSVNGRQTSFIAYSLENDSSQIKPRILEQLDEHKLLSVREICTLLRPEFDITFLRKINFHLQDLLKNKVISRSGTRPFYYSLTPITLAAVSNKPCSLPCSILEILTKKKIGFRQQELVAALSKQKIECTPVSVSTALGRLSTAGTIFRSEKQAGSRTQNPGFLYAISQESLDAHKRDFSQNNSGADTHYE